MAQKSFIEKYSQDITYSDDNIFIHDNPVVVHNPYYSGFTYVSSILSDEEKEAKIAVDKKKWDEYKKIDQPKDIKIKLFPHQLVSVYNMELLERTRKIKISPTQFYMTDFGILGDMAGYGKSMSIISLLLRDKMPWDVSKEHCTTDINSYGENLKMITNNMKKRVRPSLILASSNLIEQWKEYFSHVKKGKILVKEISLCKDMEDLELDEWDVLLVNSTRYNELMDKIGTNVVWKRFIFDDAASTPIPKMRHINAGFIWFVSATYQSLLSLRGLGYMKCFFRTFGYDTLSNLVIKNDDEFVKYSFKMPEIIEIKHKCINPRILSILGNHIDSEVKLMISAGDIKGAIAKLGGGFSNDGNLVEIVSKRHKEKLSNAKHSLEFWKARQHSEKEIDMWTKKVKELEDIIADLDKKYKDVLNDDCNICYSSISDPLLTPCCQNIFCGSCIMTWLETNKTCPLCRSVINVKELIYIDKNHSPCEDEKEVFEKKEELLVQKYEKVLEIVKKGIPEGKKILIFSSYDESFNIIRRIFQDNRIDYIEMSGTKATRDSKLRKFHTGKVNVVFLNSKFSGAGINMCEATDIIFYHEMDSYIREQNIGRAMRIGRENPLTIHNLVF